VNKILETMPRYNFPSLIDQDEDDGPVNNKRASLGRLMTADERSIYLLTRNGDYSKRYVIESRRLPLASEPRFERRYVNNEDAGDFPKTIRAELPTEIQDNLEIDAPIELLCVEGEQRRSNYDNNNEPQRLPCLLLYTSKSVFLINITYRHENTDVAFGHVSSFEEPLDRYLHGSMEKSIVRIRKAPQCSKGFAVVSPSLSFAALFENIDTGEYRLVLRHVCGSVTSPLCFTLEETIEDDRIIDFCFAQSLDELSLFSSMSVLLLKASGDVLSASPIVFNGSIVSKTTLDDSRKYLTDKMESLVDQNSAEWRHVKAASQFLNDVYHQSDNRSQFCTAQVLNQPDRSAAMWPTKLQGPIVFHSEIDPGPISVEIENFGGSECFVGIAIAKIAGKIDFVCLSPTSLLPRFAFESRNDAYELDDALFGHASIVERVDLCLDANENAAELSTCCVVIDPIANNLLHYATQSAVFTISTNIMRITNHQIQGLPVDPTRTTAWVSLNSSEAIKGIVVPTDAILGHILYVAFLRKDVALIDVAEATYLHEFDALFQQPIQNDSLYLLENGNAANATPPVYADLHPLVEKIQGGLSNMGRFIGSDTSYNDIGPDTLAVAIQTKERCDSEIVVPLLELRHIVDKHRATIMTTLAEQEVQLREAKDSIKMLQKRMTAVGNRLETARANAILLSERSSATLQTSQTLLPTITHAEYDFFQMLKRMNVKCIQLENYVRKLNDLAISRCESFDESTIAGSLKQMDQGNIEQANTLLLFEDKILHAIQARLLKTEKLTQEMVQGIHKTDRKFLQ
jgi:hypothetical protein